MKKAAIGITVLAALFYLAHWNTRCFDREIAALTQKLPLCETHAEKGNFQAAAVALGEAMNIWDRLEERERLFIPHEETDGVTEAFISMMEYLLEDSGSYSAGMERLHFRLDNLSRIEHLRLDTVF